jgi:hypothetical protein
MKPCVPKEMPVLGDVVHYVGLDSTIYAAVVTEKPSDQGVVTLHVFYPDPGQAFTANVVYSRWWEPGTWHHMDENKCMISRERWEKDNF